MTSFHDNELIVLSIHRQIWVGHSWTQEENQKCLVRFTIISVKIQQYVTVNLNLQSIQLIHPIVPKQATI